MNVFLVLAHPGCLDEGPLDGLLFLLLDSTR